MLIHVNPCTVGVVLSVLVHPPTKQTLPPPGALGSPRQGACAMQWPDTVVCQHGLVPACSPPSLLVWFGRALVMVLGSHLEGSCSLSDNRYVLVGTSHVSSTPFRADTMHAGSAWVPGRL